MTVDGASTRCAGGCLIAAERPAPPSAWLVGIAIGVLQTVVQVNEASSASCEAPGGVHLRGHLGPAC